MKTRWDRLSVKQRRQILSQFYGDGSEASRQYLWMGIGGSNSYWANKSWKNLSQKIKYDIDVDVK